MVAVTAALDDGGVVDVRLAADVLAAPNLMIVRRRSGHAAAAWFLQEPVHKYPAARDEPRR